MHPAKEGFSALPFFDEFDLSTVDVLLISQYVHLLFCLLHIHMGNYEGTIAHDNTQCEALGSGSLLLEPVSSNTSLPCTYELFEKPNTIQRHACIHVLLYLQVFRNRVFSTVPLFSVATTNCMIFSIVSTLIIHPPFHMFLARPISKEGSS